MYNLQVLGKKKTIQIKQKQTPQFGFSAKKETEAIYKIKKKKNHQKSKTSRLQKENKEILLREQKDY